MVGCIHSTYSPWVTMLSLTCLETTSKLALEDSSWLALYSRDMEGPEEQGGEMVCRSGPAISLSCIAVPLSPIALIIMFPGTLTEGSGTWGGGTGLV